MTRFKQNFLPLLLVLSASSCNQDASPNYDAELAQTSQPARHAVHTERLRMIMAGMGSRVAADWPQEIADDREARARRADRLRYAQAGRLAMALSQAASTIPGAVQTASMTDSEREEFLSNVAALRQHAVRLHQAAVERDADGMRHELSTLQTTCNRCHTRFREEAGPIGPWSQGL